MARQDSMATIDLALQQDLTVPPRSIAPPPPDATAPDAMTPKLASLTADEKRAYDVQRQSAQDEEAAIRKQLADQQRQQSALVSAAKSTLNNSQRIVRTTGVKLGNIPTPGSILLPLGILLIFFFLLIPINGHTRFVWLWLTLSGNAYVGSTNASQGTEAGSGNVSQSPSGGGQIVLPTPTAPTTFFSVPFSYTGVEDLSV